MEKNIVWHGLADNIIENCIIRFHPGGYIIRSCIVGDANRIPLKLEYVIKLDAHWRTQSLEVASQLFDEYKTQRFNIDPVGNWFADGRVVPESGRCVDFDLVLTPFTNSLPINRLQLKVGESREIDVLYIDPIARKITSDKQVYTRMSPLSYRFENNEGNYKAEIQTDELGLVSHYEGLFKRNLICDSSYLTAP